MKGEIDFNTNSSCLFGSKLAQEYVAWIARFLQAINVLILILLYSCMFSSSSLLLHQDNISGHEWLFTFVPIVNFTTNDLQVDKSTRTWNYVQLTVRIG